MPAVFVPRAKLAPLGPESRNVPRIHAGGGAARGGGGHCLSGYDGDKGGEDSHRSFFPFYVLILDCEHIFSYFSFQSGDN